MIVNLIGLLMELNAVMQLQVILVFHVLRLKAATTGIAQAVDAH